MDANVVHCHARHSTSGRIAATPSEPRIRALALLGLIACAQSAPLQPIAATFDNEAILLSPTPHGLFALTYSFNTARRSYSAGKEWPIWQGANTRNLALAADEGGFNAVWQGVAPGSGRLNWIGALCSRSLICESRNFPAVNGTSEVTDPNSPAAIARGTGDRLAVAWINGGRIVAQLFSPSMIPKAALQLVHLDQKNLLAKDRLLRIAQLGDSSRYVVTWVDRQGAGEGHLLARIVDLVTGSLSPRPIDVSAHLSNQAAGLPGLAMASQFTLFWSTEKDLCSATYSHTGIALHRAIVSDIRPATFATVPHRSTFVAFWTEGADTTLRVGFGPMLANRTSLGVAEGQIHIDRRVFVAPLTSNDFPYIGHHHVARAENGTQPSTLSPDSNSPVGDDTQLIIAVTVPSVLLVCCAVWLCRWRFRVGRISHWRACDSAEYELVNIWEKLNKIAKHAMLLGEDDLDLRKLFAHRSSGIYGRIDDDDDDDIEHRPLLDRGRRNQYPSYYYHEGRPPSLINRVRGVSKRMANLEPVVRRQVVEYFESWINHRSNLANLVGFSNRTYLIPPVLCSFSCCTGQRYPYWCPQPRMTIRLWRPITSPLWTDVRHLRRLSFYLDGPLASISNLSKSRVPQAAPISTSESSRLPKIKKHEQVLRPESSSSSASIPPTLNLRGEPFQDTHEPPDREWQLGVYVESTKEHAEENEDVSALLPFPPDGILVGYESGQIKQHTLERTVKAKALKHSDAVRSFCRIDKTRYASGGNDRQLYLWSWKAFEPLQIIQSADYFNGAIVKLACLNGSLAAGTTGGQVAVWGNEESDWPDLHEDGITGLMITNDGDIVSASLDGAVCINGEPLYESAVDLTSLVQLQDGIIALGYHSGKIEEFDVKSRKVVRTRDHQASISDLAVSHNGKLISAGLDNRVIVWTGHPPFQMQLKSPIRYLVRFNDDDAVVTDEGYCLHEEVREAQLKDLPVPVHDEVHDDNPPIQKSENKAALAE